jgi:hypothetical protein
MKKIASVALIAMVVLLIAAAPALARGGGGHHGFSGHGGFHHHGGHGHVFVGVGPFWGPYWDPWWWDYPVYAPAPVVVQSPPVYIQREQPTGQFWYYCVSAKAYYPSVQTCAEPWVPVPARPN